MDDSKRERQQIEAAADLESGSVQTGFEELSRFKWDWDTDGDLDDLKIALKAQRITKRFIPADDTNPSFTPSPYVVDAVMVLERIAPLLLYAAQHIHPEVEGAHELYLAQEEVTAWEARRNATS